MGKDIIVTKNPPIKIAKTHIVLDSQIEKLKNRIGNCHSIQMAFSILNNEPDVLVDQAIKECFGLTMEEVWRFRRMGFRFNHD